MLKIIKTDKDTYITNKIVQGKRKTAANVGAAGTLDLFKLHGLSFSGSTPNTELSRILIHFDLQSLKSLVQQGKIDVNDSSFWCELRLKDVYGGQPTPVDFNVSIFPLSASFDEGIGRDVSYYSDGDVCNWLTSSRGTTWAIAGCGMPCDAQSAPGDYITSSISIASTEATQNFLKGTEDLVVDVTAIVSATISGEIPDSGFRISFRSDLETNGETYFVKRFASKDAFDESKHPVLVVGFDDSISDDSQNLTFDTTCKLSLYNYVGGELTNLTSGSILSPITGDNCLKLKLTTQISGGYYDLYFTGSQFSYGASPVVGTYQSPIFVPSNDAIIKAKISLSGSVEFTPSWTSMDGTVTYYTGEDVTVSPPSRSGSRGLKKYSVNVYDIKSSYKEDEEVYVRVNIFDQTSPIIKLVKVPVELQGIVLKNVYYQIRDAITGETVVPFDEVKKSTKVSSDSSGMFFKFHTSGLIVGRTYTIDLMINHNGTTEKFLNASPTFRIEREN
jgi:hypothetical protein